MSFIKNFLAPAETEIKPNVVSPATEDSFDWLLSYFENPVPATHPDIRLVDPCIPEEAIEEDQADYLEQPGSLEVPACIEQTACSEEDEPLATNSPNTTIASYFSNKGFELFLPDTDETVAPVESLAFTIAINYPHTKQFIRFIRDSITKKSFDFTYSLNSSSPSERASTVALAEKLNEFGIISNWFHNKSANTIKGSISSAPRCINFINGDFMEMYAKCVTVGTLKKAAEKYSCDYEIYHNVEIIKDNKKHELDIVFRVGEHIFWSEIKSSKFDPDEYRKLGILMGVVPDRLILLAADKSNDAVNAISYFYEYYCANINTFKNSLIEMVDNAFRKEDK